MSFGEIRPQWRCLAKIQFQKTKHSTLAQTPQTNCQTWWWRGDDVGLSHWVEHDLLSIWKHSRVKCETICLTAKVLPRLGHATVQWSRAHQSSQNLQHNVWKRKNQYVSMNQSCHKLMSANLNQLKQLCKEEWNKYSTTMCPTH